MEPKMLIDILSRWGHVGTAIVLIGGSFFMRYVLIPSAEKLSDEQHAELRQNALGKWRKFVGIGIGLLLLTGFYNYIAVAIPAHRGQDGPYHPLMGIKIIAAFVMFFLASVLAGRSPKFEKMRANAKVWLNILLLLAVAVVGIAGYLKMAVKANPAEPPTVETVEPPVE